MGFGQSHELLGKVDDGNVFVCTNREELLALLEKMQRVAPVNLPNQAEYTHEEEGDVDGSGGEEENRALENQLRAKDEEQGEAPLEVIHVPNHYLGDDGFIAGHPAVLQALAASTSLRSLDIGYNALTALSVKALVGTDDASDSRVCGAMPSNLLSLNLAGNHVGKEGCKLLGEFLARDPPLRELSLFHNGLYDSDVELLLHGLIENTQLRVLNLDCNYLTEKFLRLLLSLLQQNKTLAIVVFNGSYNSETLERMHDVASQGEITHPNDVSGNARVLLRQKLLRADLAGRPRFPADLVREVEAILTGRRNAYLAELQERQETAAEVALYSMRCGNEAPCSPISAVAGVSDSWEMTEVEEQEQEPEGNEEDDTHARNCSGPRFFSTTQKKGQYARTLKFHSNRQERPALLSGSRAKCYANDSSSKNRQRSTHLRNGKMAAKELTNGFHRLTLAPPVMMPGAKTVWHTVTGLRNRLRACWCDPRDAPALYGGMLHYHCKHEPTDNELGDVAADGTLLNSTKNRFKQNSVAMLRQTIQDARKKEPEKGKKVQYSGCKATGHRCESVGLFGFSKPDKSSVFFFASPHKTQASAMDVEEYSC